MPAVSAHKLRRDAENPKADLGLRAEVVAELVEHHPDQVELELSPSVIAVLADRSGPDVALRAALKVAKAHRIRAVQVALAKLGAEPQPSLWLTRARAELGETAAAREALSAELTWLAGQEASDTPVQAALGAHFLATLATLGAPETRDWVAAEMARDKARFDLLRRCVRAARVTADQATWRKLVQAILDEVWLDYWGARAPVR